ncbi:hypothetical protein WMF12_26265 [Sorangium sp. So ce363]
MPLEERRLVLAVGIGDPQLAERVDLGALFEIGRILDALDPGAPLSSAGDDGHGYLVGLELVHDERAMGRHEDLCPALLDDGTEDAHDLGDARRMQAVLGLFHEEERDRVHVAERGERQMIEEALAEPSGVHPGAIHELDLQDDLAARYCLETKAFDRREVAANVVDDAGKASSLRLRMAK